MLSDYSGWHWLNGDPRSKLQPPAIDRLTDVKAPTLIVTGDKDLSYYHDIAAILRERIKSSNLFTVANAGHMINIEKPDEINKLISDFIAQF